MAEDLRNAQYREWKPQPKQELALRTRAYEILLGGARGGGKTDAGIAWMQKPVLAFPRYRGLVIRRNSKDLSDWVDRARYMYSGHRVEVVGNPPEIRFPGGAKILTGHLKDSNAFEQFQGHEYQRMLIEELTQIPREEDYLKLLASCRSTIDGLDARVFATSNPLNVGHAWVKKRFVDPAAPGTKFRDPQTDKTRIFIPSTVDDNQALMESDPSYVQFLEGLPDDLKKAWRYGSWDVVAGMYFRDFDRAKHIYDPHELELFSSWPRFMAIDWGFSDPMAALWFAVGPDQHVYVYREYYETGRLDIDAAKDIAAINDRENAPIDYIVGDPSSFPMKIPHYKYGEMQPVPRTDIWAEHGVHITMAKNARIEGWARIREYLKPRPYMQGNAPWLHISTACPHLVAELGTAMHDEKRPEDIDDKCVDHLLDALRYGLASRPPIFIDPGRKKTDLEVAEAQYRREQKAATKPLSEY
jgi:phage terminase large subunit